MVQQQGLTIQHSDRKGGVPKPPEWFWQLIMAINKYYIQISSTAHKAAVGHSLLFLDSSLWLNPITTRGILMRLGIELRWKFFKGVAGRDHLNSWVQSHPRKQRDTGTLKQVRNKHFWGWGASGNFQGPWVIFTHNLRGQLWPSNVYEVTDPKTRPQRKPRKRLHCSYSCLGPPSLSCSK